MRTNKNSITEWRGIFCSIFKWFIFVIIFMVVSSSCSLLTKKSSEKYVQIGANYFSNKNYSKAYKNYTKAIEVNSFCAKAYWERATVNALLDSSEKSIDDWGKFLAFSTNADSLCTAYYNRGNMMFKQGYKSDACDDWKNSIDLNGKSSNNSSEQYRLHCK